MAFVNIKVQIQTYNFNASLLNVCKCHISQLHTICIYLSTPFHAIHLYIKDQPATRSSPRGNKKGGGKTRAGKFDTAYETDDDSNRRKVCPTTPPQSTSPSHAGSINSPPCGARLKPKERRTNRGYLYWPLRSFGFCLAPHAGICHVFPP